MPLPPLEFLFDASKTLLDSLRLAALNRASNMSKQIKKDLDDWITQEATVLLVEWMMEHREQLVARREVEVKPLKIEMLERERKKSA